MTTDPSAGRRPHPPPPAGAARDRARTTQSGLESAHLAIRRAWITGVFHGLASAAILLATGRNIVLAAHYPLISAAVVVFLALCVRQGSRLAAFVLFAGVLAPAVVKLAAGGYPVEWVAFVLAAVYGHGFLGTLRYHGAASSA
jgi:hypothetical protein